MRKTFGKNIPCACGKIMTGDLYRFHIINENYDPFEFENIRKDLDQQLGFRVSYCCQRMHLIQSPFRYWTFDPLKVIWIQI